MKKICMIQQIYVRKEKKDSFYMDWVWKCPQMNCQPDVQ